MKDMTHTTIHLNEAFSSDEHAAIPVSLAALKHDSERSRAVVLDVGPLGRGQFSVQLAPRSARKLGTYLIAFADTADSVNVQDPTLDAPEITDDDAPEDIDDVVVTAAA